MRAVDTNVIIRLITGDDPGQMVLAEDFISEGAWVSFLVMAESIWVLDTVFRMSPNYQADAVQMLLNHDDLVVDQSEIVTAALELFRVKPALGFSDCLIIESARKAGHLPLGTFDRTLAKVPGAQKL